MSYDVDITIDDCRCCKRKGGIVYSSNYTWNQNQTLYEVENCGPNYWHGKTCRQVARKLRLILKHLAANRERHEKEYPSNGWGTLDAQRKWIEHLLDACKQFPDGLVTVC